MPILFFVLAALLFATGGLSMKYSEGLTRLLPSLAVFLCFAAGAALQALGMRGREMGPAYTFVLGLEAIVAVGFGIVFLGERINAARVFAIALVLIGIALLERA